jgi:Ankyrin repeats (3 copies)
VSASASKEGELRYIDAITYVSAPPLEAERAIWDINRFVKRRCFRLLSGAQSSSLRVSEEKQLAKIMGVAFVLPGDALSDAVLRKNVNDISQLLGQGDDVNAPCQGYGQVLQAATAEGSEEIVSLLLKLGADVNASGGQYESALLAATVLRHEMIARILIKAGADVLKIGGLYISPLYQAVGHSDVDMVLLLEVEHG